MSNKQKIILFGGTFDPIHNGHLAVAQHALQLLSADEFIFVPARQSPHKQQAPTDGTHRIAMIRCAIEPSRAMSVSDCELQRQGPSYTIETIRFFRNQFGPEAVLCWLIGADQLDDLPKWYCIGELLKECRICTMVRGGYPLPEMNRFAGIFPMTVIRQLENDLLRTPEIPISGTAIRNQLMQGVNPQGQIPDCVLSYIIEHKLYGFKMST